ncbi:MAG: hypothetical protein R3F59_03525 [Myxococcota bacterium]
MLEGRSPPRARRWPSALVVASAVVSSLACGPKCESSPRRGYTAGEFGQGLFVWQCVAPGDAACPGDGTSPRRFPEAVAVGGRFAVWYDASDPNVSPSVRSPTDLVLDDRGELVAVAPGLAAVGAYVDDGLYDILHLRIVEPVLSVYAEGAGPLPVGEVRTLSVEATDGEGGAAAGALAYEWTASPPGAVRLVERDRRDRIDVIAQQEGTVVVTATVGGASRGFELQIAPGPVDTAADTATPADTATDTAADTGSAP